MTRSHPVRILLRRPLLRLGMLALFALVPASSFGASSAATSTTAEADAGTPAPVIVPPQLITPSPARYPPELLEFPVAGDVQLELTVNADGGVEDSRVLSSPHPALAREALHASVNLLFAPATADGVATGVRLQFSYRFEVPKRVEPPPTATLRGMVRSRGNRRPISGATLEVENTALRVQTDADGRFELVVPRAEHSLRISSPGFTTNTLREDLRKVEQLEVLYALNPDYANAYETVVVGERERTEVSRVSLREQEIREVPGTMGDPFRVVMLLPGVSTMVSGIAYPVVRGSSPAATGYFIDGIRVPMLFHLFLGPAVVHPDFLDGVDFYPGAPPARYGRLLGGVVEGRVSRPREKGLHFTAYADLINAGGFVEYPFEKTGTHVTLSGRYSYTPWLVALVGNSIQPPPPPGLTNPRLVLDFYDYQGRIEQRIGPGRLRLLAFGSSDVVGTTSDDPRVAWGSQSVSFHRVDLRYQHPIGVGRADAALTYGIDRTETRVFQPGLGEQGQAIDQHMVMARAGWEGELAREVELRSGLDVEQRRAAVVTRISLGNSVPPITASTPIAVGTFVGAWSELVIRRAEHWTFVPGLRFDSFHLVPGINRFAVEPRLTVRRQLGEQVVLKAAAGLYHQPPTFLINLPVVDVASLRTGLQEGIQLDIGAEWKIIDGLELTADVYFNPLLTSIEINPFNTERVSSTGQEQPLPLPTGQDAPAISFPVDVTRGYAYGLEVMLRHPLGNNWFGWISYSLQRSVRRQGFYRYDEYGQQVGTSTAYLPFAFDQTHVFNAVASYQLPWGWTLGAVVHFHTGAPESGNFGSRTLREGTTPPPNSDPAWVTVSRDKVDRLPLFFRVDARVSKTWVLDAFTFEMYLDFLNVAFNGEVIGFNYNQEFNPPYNLKKEPIAIPLGLPILGVKGKY